ncbi:hypothetical protein SLS62_010195 [Diatrype stigma]|uniref:Indole-diterpene biosynthesis protein PaxU n=1 Tax=Diatrype stigma TaxID=117547 RepID=A0AAN9UA96_9PEZI
MASRQPAATPAKPLAMMTRLSPWVFYYKPPKTRTTASSTPTTGSGSESNAAPAPALAAPPKLILIASWMDARDAHIAKYVAYYQATYPAASILLIKFTRAIAWRSAAAQRAAVQAAASQVRALVEAGVLSAAPRSPEVLVHALSNGGAASTRSLYQVYRRKAGGRAFPPHAAVYDSCPGRNSARRTYHAFMVGVRGFLARLLAAPVIAAAAALLALLYGPLSFLAGEGPLRESQRVHNDRVLVRQTNRTYVYSKEDDMVDWRHVEEHAREAAAKGVPVRMELYENSAHVAHMRNDSERYWRIVTETWEEGARRSGTLLPGFA